jgi:ABC-type nitrate/sulfonate/bicarbonate transport system substrate-binding protein
LIVAADSPCRTIQDLVGKRIGIKKGTSTYGGYLKYLAGQGIPGDRIEVVNLDPDTMPDALAAGSSEAFAASEPTPSLGELRGGRELATFAGQGNSFPIMMLATERLTQERPDELRRFLAVLREAEAYIASHPEEAANLVAKSIGLPPEATANAMARHQFRLNLDPATLASLRETAEFLRGQGVVETVPELKVFEPGK